MAMQSMSAQNRRCRGQLKEEMTTFFAALPYGKTLLNCSPTDLLANLRVPWASDANGGNGTTYFTTLCTLK